MCFLPLKANRSTCSLDPHPSYFLSDLVLSIIPHCFIWKLSLYSAIFYFFRLKNSLPQFYIPHLTTIPSLSFLCVDTASKKSSLCSVTLPITPLWNQSSASCPHSCHCFCSDQGYQWLPGCQIPQTLASPCFLSFIVAFCTAGHSLLFKTHPSISMPKLLLGFDAISLVIPSPFCGFFFLPQALNARVPYGSIIGPFLTLHDLSWHYHPFHGFNYHF